MRDTWLFEMPSHPRALTRSSTRLVDIDDLSRMPFDLIYHDTRF